MAEENKVILHGMWASIYSRRVELALKIKGIPFEYVEEDLQNKSQLLLKYNPIYKKVPVLVHNGKPIAESLVIIEYIDETWKNEPKLLPEDPYQRAKVRFWAAYFQQGIIELFPTGIPQNHGHLGLLDVLIGISLSDYKIHEQVWGVKFLNPEKNPYLFSWVNHLIELPVMKQIALPEDELVSLIELYKQKLQIS